MWWEGVAVAGDVERVEVNYSSTIFVGFMFAYCGRISVDYYFLDEGKHMHELFGQRALFEKRRKCHFSY